MAFGDFTGWGRQQGKHSHIGYDPATGLEEDKGKLRLGTGDPRVSTAAMQKYTWEGVNTNTTKMKKWMRNWKKLYRRVSMQKIAAALARAPHDNRSIEDWATRSGLSSRSLARHWLAETHMTLSQWRQRLRVLLALPRLLSGEPVISVALSMGYDTPSAFIAVFKREMGVTPARYGKGDGGD